MQTNAPSEQAGTFNGWDYLSILRQQRRIIYLSLIICCVIAASLRFLLPTRYESQVVTLPSPSSGSATRPVALTALSGLGLSFGAGGTNPKEEAIATLNARSFLIDFVHRQNLMPVLFADDWNKDTKSWKKKPPTDEEAYDKLHGAMTITSTNTSNLVTLAVRWTDSATAAFIANHLMQRLNKQSQDKAVAEANRMIGYLTEAYGKVQISEVRTNIADLIQDQVRQRILAQSRDEYALTIIDPALPSKKRVTPPGLTILLPLGAFLGLFFGISGAFLAHSARPRWRGPFARLLAPRP
jgi:uncharacterized protein involved in exopolysaccharide biosynthesis